MWCGIDDVAALVLCWGLAESDVTVMPPVTCMDWLHWWYKHGFYVIPPSSSAFGTKLSETHKSTSPSAMQVKNRQKTINIEETLVVISWLEKDERISDICRNFKFGVCKSVHHHTFNWINQPVGANSQVYYLSFKYSSTCFGHPHAHHQELQQLQ